MANLKVQLAEEYELDEISEFEDRYADEFEALEDMDDENENEMNIVTRPKVLSKKENRLSQDSSTPKSKKKLGNEFLQSIECVSPVSKKQRIEHSHDAVNDDDDDDIEAPFKIIESNINKPVKLPVNRAVTTRDKKYVYKMPPFGTDSIAATNCDGRRVYLKLSMDNDNDQDDFEDFHFELKRTGLLAVPFYEIKQAVDDKRHQAMLDKANAMNELFKKLKEDDKDVEFVGDENCNSTQLEEALWVEKYTPKHFTELLSDDGINRVLLKWLKLWDKFVFGKSTTKTRKSKGNQVTRDQSRFGKRKFVKDYEDELDSDESERPTYKIALLAGNPGLGKTTLAHIVARHAGYNPVEMNASDDRSAELFKNKLETATQMKSCIGNDNKPNCLIIDEIDGAPLQAINILIQAAKETEESSKTQKKKKRNLTITRPIICICNDQYVPALRQLRQMSLTLTVPTISPGRLAQRLLEISRKERLKSDMTCLLALCDKSENDIRSCVNTLQFISKKHGEVKAQHLQDVSIGQKDFQKDLSFVWKSVFQLPKSNRRSLAFLQHANKDGLGGCNLALSRLQHETGASSNQSSNSVRFHNILHLASANSEYEKMIQGIFDNYLNVKSKDPRLETVVDCVSWLEFSDLIDTRIRSRQTFTLMKFFPFLPVAFHMSMATTRIPKINFNNSMIEFNLKLSRSKQLVEGITHEVRPNVKRVISNDSLISDLLPYLYEVIHPTLRPVNIQLYSQSEKQNLLDLISIMISYNLTYQQERNIDGQFTYVLQPNIEELIAFHGLRQHIRMSYAAKQLIQREIDLEKMRKAEQSIQINDREKKEQKDVRVVKALKPMKVKATTAKPVLDFFGRAIKTTEKSEQEKQKKPSIINTSIWYKFNEGYTNAVRRTVKVKDFL
eukprot:gene9084-10053_t